MVKSLKSKKSQQGQISMNSKSIESDEDVSLQDGDCDAPQVNETSDDALEVDGSSKESEDNQEKGSDDDASDNGSNHHVSGDESAEEFAEDSERVLENDESAREDNEDSGHGTYSDKTSEEDVKERSKREIYLGGLPYNVEEHQIRDMAKEFGSIQSIKICKGFAFVIFDVPESAVAAADALNNFKFESRVLRSNVCADRFSDKVQKNNKPREGTGLAVILKNLSFDTTEDTVKKSLRNCGEVLSVRIPIFHDTQKSRGWCIVEFSNADDVEKALALGTLSVDGRTVRIERQNLNMKSSSSGEKYPRDTNFRNKRPWFDKDQPDKRHFSSRDGGNRRDFREGGNRQVGSRDSARPYQSSNRNTPRGDRGSSFSRTNEYKGTRKVFD